MAKQTINLGAAPNDGTGDSLRSGGDKINDNFDELYLDNVVHINSADDFPAAVGGVRELVPSSGANITYLIAAKNIDVGSDRFTVTDGDVVIRGTHRTASQITTTNTGVMFTSVDSNFFVEYVGFTCTDATWLDWSNPGANIVSVANQNAIIYDCETVAIIEDAFTTSLRTFTVIQSSVEGILWEGANSQINISQMLAYDWGGTLLDLGTATFDIVNIATGSRFISPIGSTIMSGLTANGNMSVGGRGIVEGNLFNGVGTAINGIDTQDLQWNFQGNIFADNTTANTRAITDAFMTTTQNVTVSSSNTYYAIGGVNWSSDVNSRFTVGTDGLVTYNGLETIGVIVTSSATLEKQGGGSDFISMEVAINGVTQLKSKGSTDNTSPAQVVSNGVFLISTGDTIQLYVANEDSTSNIIVDQATMIIRKEI